jgi:hypothetical protein
VNAAGKLIAEVIAATYSWRATRAVAGHKRYQRQAASGPLQRRDSKAIFFKSNIYSRINE